MQNDVVLIKNLLAFFASGGLERVRLKVRVRIRVRVRVKVRIWDRIQGMG